MFYVVIMNTKSGMNTVQKNVEKVVVRLRSAGHQVQVFQTEVEGDAEIFAANLPECDLIVSVGGDGTMNEVINGILSDGKEQKIPLAMIPAGTVNDFANYFKLPIKEQLIYQYLTSFKTTLVDIGMANNRYFTNVVAAGFISDVGYRVQKKHKKRWGKIAYYFEGFSAALRYMKRTSRFTFKIGDHQVTLDAYMFIALNTTHLGGLSYFAPDASCDDGLIDLFIIKKTGLIGGFILLVEMLFGRHIDDKNVIYFKVKEFGVDSRTPLEVDVDGERGTLLPYQVKMLKQGLHLALPSTQ